MDKMLETLLESFESGEVPRCFIDVKSGKNFGQPTVSDFGDCFPFVWYWGKVRGRNDFVEWAESTSKISIRQFQAGNGLFLTKFGERDFEAKKNYFDADKMSDVSLGLNLMYQLTKDEFYLKSCADFFDGLSSEMISNNFICYKKSNWIKWPVSNGKFTGLYIEEAVNLSNYSKNKKYFEFAEKSSEPWIENSFFKENGLFSFASTSRILKPVIGLIFKKETGLPIDSVMLTKSNVNLIFGLVKVYDSSKSDFLENVFEKWVNALEQKMLMGEGVFRALWPGDWKVHYLGGDHAVIDALLEIYKVTGKKEALNLAESVASAWLSKADKSGLIPEIFFEYSSPLKISNPSMEKKFISRLDSQTDFLVVLLKLSELSGNKKYARGAAKILEGILGAHSFKNLFVEYYNIKTGKPENFVVETKFLFLLLKVFIAIEEMAKGNKINSPFMNELLRDR
ncbi:MAG: hypothetical protein NTZ73_01110 [Candidatus Diapherotrites archaeon]|nr:hypothetical protein [Candidatus Diapherotrites archaeon]